MPSGVIFVVCIPSSNYEHILKFGKPKDLVPIDDEDYKPIRLAVELRNKKSRSIPIHLTQNYYNAAFNPMMENISEDSEFFTMESVSRINLFIVHCNIASCSLGTVCFKSASRESYFVFVERKASSSQTE